MTSISLTEPARAAWTAFLEPHQNRGHLRRDLCGKDIDEHVAACFASSADMASKFARLLVDRPPRAILEIGASAGLNCIALERAFPSAVVVGVEPEAEAVFAAERTAEAGGATRCVFVRGVGERLPLPSDHFDLIVCHTVIEHVLDVPRVIAEMARVLRPRGTISLEAPNYVWPKEPHLDVWCIPLLGKRSIKWLSRVQGRSKKEGDFVDHLQLVHPRMLETNFRSVGLQWTNEVEAKLATVLAGDLQGIKAYKALATALRILHRARVGRQLAKLVMALGVYPSVIYRLTKVS